MKKSIFAILAIVTLWSVAVSYAAADHGTYYSKSVTRGKFLKDILSPYFPKAAKPKKKCANDVRRLTRYSEYICLAKKLGIIKADRNGNLRPYRKTTATYTGMAMRRLAALGQSLISLGGSRNISQTSSSSGGASLSSGWSGGGSSGGGGGGSGGGGSSGSSSASPPAIAPSTSSTNSGASNNSSSGTSTPSPAPVIPEAPIVSSTPIVQPASPVAPVVDGTPAPAVTSLTRLAAGMHQYSSVNPFNANGRLILLQKPTGGVMYVRDSQGNIVRDNLGTYGIQERSDPVWSRKDPDLLYFHPRAGNTLKSYRVSTNEVKTLHTFSGYTEVSFGLGEGDISWDSDHLPVVGDRRWGLVHTISTGRSSQVMDLLKFGGTPDSFDLTSRNNVVFIRKNPGGTEMFDAEMNHLGKLVDYQGHSDRARDSNGNDYLVLTNSDDATPISSCQNGIVKVAAPGGRETCLQQFSWNLAVHVSCNNWGQDWCLVSTYTSKSGDVPYKNQILKVYLDGRKTEVLANSGSSNSEYYRFPRAAVSGDGRFVLFDSDQYQSTPHVFLVGTAIGYNGTDAS